MASECMRSGLNQMALDVLEKGLKRHPTLRCALTLKGRALILLGRANEAGVILGRVVEADGENLLARRLLEKIKGGVNKAVAAKTPVAEKKFGREKKAAPPHDARTVRTLEKWLNNAAQMRKG